MKTMLLNFIKKMMLRHPDWRALPYVKSAAFSLSKATASWIVASKFAPLLVSNGVNLDPAVIEVVIFGVFMTAIKYLQDNYNLNESRGEQ